MTPMRPEGPALRQDAGIPARGAIRRLLFVYLSALAMIVVSVALSMMLTQIEARHLEDDAKEINVSGRQRMLSQRILYLSRELEDGGGGNAAQTRAELAVAIKTFEVAVTLFETSHLSLSTRPDLAPDVTALYFSDAAGPSLDARVRGFIAAARRVLDRSGDPGGLAELRRIERQGLLRDLDRVVSATEGASVARVRFLRQVEFYSLAFAVAVILFEVAYVFVPGHRLIERSLKELENRNGRLRLARSQLDARNEVLEAQYLRISSDAARLRAAWEESERLRGEQSEFTYAISHDIKSPVNTLNLLLNELTVEHGTQLDEDGRELLVLSVGTVERIGDLIEDVLEYSWATGAVTVAETVDLDAVLRDVLADMKADIVASGAVIEAGQMGQIRGHRVQLRLLLQNLLANAIKFQPDGVAPQVRVSCAPLPEGDGLCLSVRDNGIGIAPENHGRIFGMFQRLHLREDYPGTGLGLATCRRIAGNHGGQIRVASVPGQGSTFHVSLHSRAESEDEETARAA